MFPNKNNLLLKKLLCICGLPQRTFQAALFQLKRSAFLTGVLFGGEMFSSMRLELKQLHQIKATVELI
jgi:hypothetical protein